MLPATGKDKILLHLLSFTKISPNSKTTPFEICQSGISQEVDLRQPRVSIYLRDFIEDGLVRTETKYVAGSENKRKVYFLTQEGQKKARDLKKKLEDEEAILYLKKGKENIKLSEIDKYITSRNPLLTALNRMDEDEVIDLTFSQKDKEDLFIGRRKEMKQLKNSLDESLEGMSKTILISGEAGIGKTRLVSEFKKAIENKGYEFLSGRAYYGSSEPYIPFKEALKDYFDETDNEKKLVPGEEKPLFFLGTNGSKVAGDETFNGQRKSIWYDFGRMLKKRASKKPLVIFLDDLQWGDQASILMLNYLSIKITDSPIMFIATYRPEDVHETHPLKDVISQLTRENVLKKIHLESLDWEDIRNIVQHLVGRSDVPNSFIDLVNEITEGNPLFVRECVKYMLEEGLVDVKNNEYPTSDKEVILPNIVEEVIDHRIRKIKDGDTRRLLQLGSVIGETVPFRLLTRCSDMKTLDILDHVERLMDFELWYEMPKGEMFSFTHYLVKKRVYESVPKNVRKSLHLLVADNIENVYEDEINRYYSDLGYHYENAEEFRKAIDYYKKAGKEAENVYAHEDAVDILRNALELVGKVDVPLKEQFSLVERLADIHKILRNYDQSLEYYKDCMHDFEIGNSVRIYRKIGDLWVKQGEYEKGIESINRGLNDLDEDNQEYCRLLYLKGIINRDKGKLNQALDLFDKGLKKAEELENNVLVAEGYHNKGTVYIFLGKYDESITNLEKAIDLWEKEEHMVGLSRSLNNLGVRYVSSRDFSKALNTFERSLEIANEINMDYFAGTPYGNIGLIKQTMGDLEEAEKYFKRSKELRKRYDEKNKLVLVFVYLGTNSYKKGDFDSALDYNKKSLSLAEEMGHKRGMFIALSHIGIILRRMGKFDQALERLKKSLEICKDLGDKMEVADKTLLIGFVRRDKEDMDSAIEEFKNSMEIYEEIEHEYGVANNELALTETYLNIGDMDKARSHMEEAIDSSEEIDDIEFDVEFYRVKGKLHRMLGEYEKALNNLKRSKKFCKRLSDIPDLTEIEFEIGLTHIQKGDDERGFKILEQTRDKFNDMGMTPMKKKCDTYLNNDD